MRKLLKKMVSTLHKLAPITIQLLVEENYGREWQHIQEWLVQCPYIEVASLTGRHRKGVHTTVQSLAQAARYVTGLLAADALKIGSPMCTPITGNVTLLQNQLMKLEATGPGLAKKVSGKHAGNDDLAVALLLACHFLEVQNAVGIGSVNLENRVASLKDRLQEAGLSTHTQGSAGTMPHVLLDNNGQEYGPSKVEVIKPASVATAATPSLSVIPPSVVESDEDPYSPTAHSDTQMQPEPSPPPPVAKQAKAVTFSELVEQSPDIFNPKAFTLATYFQPKPAKVRQDPVSPPSKEEVIEIGSSDEEFPGWRNVRKANKQ